jgi:hypothetical protein
MWGDKPEFVDDHGFPHEDVRKLVNSLIFIEKNTPAMFAQTEHERMNLVYFAKEFIVADKAPVTPMQLMGMATPFSFTAGPEAEDEEDDESEPVQEV